ncbi:unnamed protein product, partial [Urochloa humidicola]
TGAAEQSLEGLLDAPPPAAGDPSPPAPPSSHRLEGQGERLPAARGKASSGTREGRVAAVRGRAVAPGMGSVGARGGGRPATRSGGAGGERRD